MLLFQTLNEHSIKSLLNARKFVFLMNFDINIARRYINGQILTSHNYEIGEIILAQIIMKREKEIKETFSIFLNYITFNKFHFLIQILNDAGLFEGVFKVIENIRDKFYQRKAPILDSG